MSWIIPTNLPKPVEIIDVRSILPVNPKGGWEVFKERRDINKLTRIVLHHDALYSDQDKKKKIDPLSDVELMSNISTSHINSKKNRADGDGGFPYHLYIRNGKLYIANNMEAFTYGVANNNGYTIHICVYGNYLIDKLSEADQYALSVALLMAKNSMPKFFDIKGHGEITPTQCPAYSVSESINRLNVLQKEIDQSLNQQSAADRAYQIANQIIYTYNIFAKGKLADGSDANEGQKKWAQQQVLSLEPEMKRLGMLK